MIIVLDANVAVELALARPYADYYRNLLSTADMIIVPDIFASEITNVFWKYHSFAALDEKTCQAGVRYCLDLVDDFIDTKKICLDVLATAIQVKHSTYDIFYLVTAQKHQAVLLTMDKKLVAMAQILNVKVLNHRMD